MTAVTAGHTVMAPNTELGAALFDAVERAYRDAGRDIWPTPRVRDFGSWLREKHGGGEVTEATLRGGLRDIEERELWRAVIDSSDVGRDLAEPTGAARAARRARRAIHEYAIPLRAIADHASASEESRAFLDWNRQFSERCRQLDCIGSDELLGQTPAPAEPISWIESPVWRPVARQWLQHHGRMLAPPGGVPRTVCRLNAASPAAELAAIADWALDNLRSSERFRAWVCLPDLNPPRPGAVDALDAALAPQRFTMSDASGEAPYAVAGGTPLAQYAPLRAALDTLAASLGPVPFERFSALLRAPELQSSAAEAGAAALLDLQLRKQGPSQADLPTWLALADRIAAAHSIGSAPPPHPPT